MLCDMIPLKLTLHCMQQTQQQLLQITIHQRHHHHLLATLAVIIIIIIITVMAVNINEIVLVTHCYGERSKAKRRNITQDI